MAEDKLYRVVKASDRLPEENTHVVCQWWYKDGNQGLYRGTRKWLENVLKEHGRDAVAEWFEPVTPPESLEKLEEDVMGKIEQFKPTKETRFGKELFRSMWKFLKPKIASMMQEKEFKYKPTDGWYNTWQNDFLNWLGHDSGDGGAKEILGYVEEKIVDKFLEDGSQMSAELSWQSDKIQSLQTQLEDKNNEIELLHISLTERSNRIKELEQQIDELKNQYK